MLFTLFYDWALISAQIMCRLCLCLCDFLPIGSVVTKTWPLLKSLAPFATSFVWPGENHRTLFWNNPSINDTQEFSRLQIDVIKKKSSKEMCSIRILWKTCGLPSKVTDAWMMVSLLCANVVVSIWRSYQLGVCLSRVLDRDASVSHIPAFSAFNY